MKIGIAVFAYNRNKHLSKVLDALKQNERADALYIFQNGLGSEAHREGWEKTRAVIESVDWCEKKIVYAERSKELSQEIIDGVDTVLEENDAIIVLEDDCVPAPCFISYMKQCFEKYEKEEKIYCVSGYKFPIPMIKPENQDILFAGRPCAWGWGTWKDRWKIFRRDYKVIDRIRANKESSKRLATWGMDLENMLNVQRRNGLDGLDGVGTWDVYWALAIIEQGGYCISPHYELIQNIGHDGTGTHCSNNQSAYDVKLFEDKELNVKFPQEIAYSEDVVKGLPSWNGCGSYAVAASDDESKESILVYGTGNFYCHYEKELVEKYFIKGYVDKYKKGYFCGKMILAPEQVKTEKFDKIVIMLADVKESRKVAENLHMACGIDADRIFMGENVFALKMLKED